jgi:hypothetical protein
MDVPFKPPRMRGLGVWLVAPPIITLILLSSMSYRSVVPLLFSKEKRMPMQTQQLARHDNDYGNYVLKNTQVFL